MRPGSCTLRLARASLALAWLVLHIALAQAAGPAAALVADVEGDARLAGGDALRLLQELPAGADLALAERSRAVLFALADGAQYTIIGPGAFHLGPKGPLARKGAATPQRQAAAPGLRDLRLRGGTSQAAVVMRGGADGLTLIEPVDEVVVDATPTFVWQRAADAASPGAEPASYRFELVDDDGRSLHVASTASTSLTLPSGIEWRPGARYAWAVGVRDAATGRNLQRTATFRVVDAATARRIDAARPSPGAPFADRALYVALLDSVGARSAARSWRDRLASERPAAWAGDR